MDYVPASLMADFYKLFHIVQYPEKTETVYSTWTARISRIPGINEVVVAGYQAFNKEILCEFFTLNFFSRNKEDVVQEYRRCVKYCLGVQSPDTKHIEELHSLGYLPLSMKALPEGTVVPLRVPILTIQNTHPKFAWLTNFIESMASSEMWHPITSATIARQYRKILDKYAMETVGDISFVDFQGHDFSMRGMSGIKSGAKAGFGHLLSFKGTDSIPSIYFAERFYNANMEKELIGTSIPATEHSVMCANGSTTDEQEYEAYKRLITEVYPNGFVSIVSDTRDFWRNVEMIGTKLKEAIIKRDGRVVIRPDSGDPVKIIIGDKDATHGTLEHKGLVAALWDYFGGTTTKKGFKLLDSHIGCIYGEAINLERAEAIVEGLKEQGFASINCVFGIGSYTYQYVTRDTFGLAYKSTLCVINGDQKQLFKNPKTDDGSKASQKGRVAVVKRPDGKLECIDNLFLNTTIPEDQLVEVFRDGKILVDQSLAEIRQRLTSQ